jgi:hypothetical protein
MQLLAPFTFGLGENNSLEIKKNKIEASSGIFSNDLGIEVSPVASVTSNSIKLLVNVRWVTNSFLSSETVIVGIKGPNTGKVEKATLAPSASLNQSGEVTFSGLQPETTYFVYIKASQNSTSLLGLINNIALALPHLIGGWIGADEWPLIGVLFEVNESDGEISNVDSPYDITTLSNTNTSTQQIELDKLKNPASYMPECDIMKLGKTLPGCIGVGLYSLIFKPSSFLFAKTGQLLDFTYGYSVRDQSYRSSFVVEGWKVVKDFCNMFFIFVLLYIAFGTILNLNGVKTKEMIINVVIIGLLINFSLFATQVIIDTSNIIARVFYNAETIQVGPKVDGVIQNETGDSGEIKLSEALVSKINPQNLIINATDIENVKIKGDLGDGETKGGISAGTFILIVILASVINIVGLVVFLTCALLFVTRVVGLWIAMIFAPLAFFSYLIPRMQDMDMIGWKKWWPDTISLAFMAPVFIFFLYLIIKFLETGMGLTDASSSWNINTIDFILKTFVPFIFIMILLMKAKSIAVKMSGKMGEAVSKIGAAAAGIGLAAATGGAAMAMRGTIGRYASNVANSEKLKEDATKGGFRGLQARMRLKAASGVSKSSFDVRNTKLGASAAKGLGVEANIGKAKEGGFKGYEDRKIKRKVEDSKLLEMSEAEAAKQDAAARNDPTHMTLTAAQENQRRKNAYAKNLGTDNEINAATSRELTKGQLSDEDVSKTTKSLATTEKELNLINNNLETLARRLGVRVDEITQTDINNLLKRPGDKEEQLTIKETEIIKWTAALNANPNDAAALSELALANIEKNKLKNEIAETKSLINDRETYTNRQTQLKEKLKSK